jgi:glucose-6-phosphate isomerase
MKNLKKYLLDAASKEKTQISVDNPYREIAFDQGKARLGWVKPVNFSQIRSSLESILSLLENKKKFIFIGMGGSVNGIKPLLSVFGRDKIFTLDNLDPKAINDILAGIDSLEETLVITISKSGTTKETQLLSQTLRSYFSEKLGVDKWAKNFLWLTDPESFEKLDKKGWSSVEKMLIQFDGRSDVGGRFSSPLTNIFILPLFLFLNKDFDKLEQFYLQFISSQDKIINAAYNSVLSLSHEDDFNFSPHIGQNLVECFTPWLAQLFQESLGSKNVEKSVKTIVNFSGSRFIKLKPNFNFREPVLSIMAQMYFYQLFIAYLAGRWNINFVNQEFVEKYKKKMSLLEQSDKKSDSPLSGNLASLAEQISKKIKDKHRFIEVVLYFVPDQEIISSIQKELEAKFDQKIILVFVGSDWNHQCYQAAFADKTTFYALIYLSSYQNTKFIAKGRIDENLETLKRIALATYQTLLDKSILFVLKK